MKSKDLKKIAFAKKALLGQVLKKNQRIKKNVKKAASELTFVNEILEQEDVTVQVMEQALIQNKDVEQRVAQAADDLRTVNVELANEVAERMGIESELAEMKTELAGVRDDLSNSEVNVEIAQQRALQDPLTGLPNRISFEQGLAQGLIQAKRHAWGLAVLFIDIDKFKAINDSYGHGMGDQVLLTVANRLKSFVRGGDTVSRWGGDEFVCLLLEVQRESDVVHVATQLVNRIAESFEFNGTVLSITSSIGIAMYPEDGETAEILFKKADIAMYEAKGTNRRVFLSSSHGF
jgi:diguanylate cyclase (GGDEF)-like protein